MPLRFQTSARRHALIAILCLAISQIVSVPPGRANETDPDRPRENLVAVQSRVVEVVRQNMEACVAISDGMGFGSGVIVNPEGLILTAGHVVSTGVEEFDLFFPSGKTARARLIGYNLNVDAAMLQIEGTGPWPFVKLAGENAPSPGSWAVGLGHSGGYELGRKPPVRTGRLLEIRDHMLVTDSVLIGGDSGGPLFNLNGELIGIHSSIGDVISENRHVSLATFRQFWDRMARGECWGSLPELGDEPAPGQKQGKQPPSTSGNQPTPGPSRQPPAPDAHHPVPAGKGGSLLGIVPERNRTEAAVIGKVQANTPAARVGLKAGDRILSVNGKPVRSGEELESRLAELPAGGTAELQVQRNTSVFRLVVILDNF